MTYLPLGFKSAMNGTLSLIRWKSSKVTSTPHAFAMAIKCRTAFVLPPVAITNTIAFSKLAFVIMSLGLMSRFINSSKYLPANRHSTFFNGSSAGVELMHCEILVMVRTKLAFDAIPGIRNPFKSKFQMACGRMDDAIDLAGVMKCVDEARGPSGTNEIVTAIVKADPAASVRGRRTTMLSDSDINATRHSRAAVGGVVAAAVGDCRVYVSGGAEHQGPDGGGPVCVISRVRTPGSEEGTKRKR